MANNNFNIKITANADGVKTGVDQAKEHLDLAADSVALLGEMIGVQVPEAVQKLLASTEGLGTALNAAFVPLQIISFLQQLEEAQRQVREALNGTSQGWRELSQDVFQFHQDAEIKLIQLAERLDELKGNHLAALHDKLREIDAQSLKDLGSQFDEIAKKADSLFANMELGWFKTFALGKSAAQDGIKNVHQEFDLLMDDIKKMEKAGNFTGIGNALDSEIARIQDRLKTAKNWAITAQGEEILSARRQELQVLQDLKAAYEDIARINQREKSAADQGTAPLRAAEQERAARAFMQSLEDELTAEKQTHLVSIQEELHFWQSKLAAASKYPDVYRNIQKTIAGIDQQIFTQREVAAQHAAQSQEEANQRANAQILKDAKAQNDAIIAKNKELLDAQATLYKSDIDNAKVNEQIKVQLAEADLARGKINKKQEVQIVAAAKQEEIRLEIQAWQAIESLYDQEPKKVAEIEAKISRLRAQARLADAKAIADEAKATESTYKQLWSSIGNTFKSTLDGIIQGHETAAQAVQKLLSGLLQDIANYLEQKAMKEAAALVTSLIQKKTEATASISADAGKSFSSAFADMASLGPAGLAAAPGAAVAAGTTTKTGGMALLTTSFDVGAWKVPFDMPAIVHAGEMVVPRFESDLFRNAVQNGGQGGGVTVVVNHSVSAVDAQSFQGTIRRNSNMIANEIVRALRKKGLAIA